MAQQLASSPKASSSDVSQQRQRRMAEHQDEAKAQNGIELEMLEHIQAYILTLPEEEEEGQRWRHRLGLKFRQWGDEMRATAEGDPAEYYERVARVNESIVEYTKQLKAEIALHKEAKANAGAQETVKDTIVVMGHYSEGGVLHRVDRCPYCGGQAH